MDKIKEEIKKVLSNKNTLTILIVIIGIICLYAIYNYRVTQAVTTIRVPYAKKEITSRSQITTDAIGYTELPKRIARNLGIVTSTANITNNYVKYGETIPANSFFFKDYIVTFEEATTNEFSDIPDGYTAYNLAVDINSTYGNSIYTGNYVDLFVKATSNANRVIFGRLIQGIKVLAVLDSSGNDVFESSTETRTPAQMWFAVPDELYTLLKKTEYIGGITVMPIPRNASYSATDRDATIDSQYIQNFILSKSITVSQNFSTNTDTNPNQDNTNTGE